MTTRSHPFLHNISGTASWSAPAPTSGEADAMHALLVQRADALEGCSEGSEEERELAPITDAIEAYEINLLAA